MKNRNIIFTTILLLAGCFGLLPNAQAVSPAPDGGYPGGNTAEGQAALLSRTSGGFNTAIGFLSLRNDTTNSFNTAIGAGTLLANTADENTATGVGALLSNTTGSQNTAAGAFALVGNTTGSDNTANGAFALFSNTTGSFNTANGNDALTDNSTGNGNTATGENALQFTTTGNNNTANGVDALENNTIGIGNTAIGLGALQGNGTGNTNTAIGEDALNTNTTGGFNTALGVGAGSGVTTANNVTCIGANVGAANVDSTTWIGNVYGVTTQSGTTAPVIVSDGGQLGTVVSSERFKKDIATMEKASEAILSLRPVTFRYKTDIRGTPQFGLIAEEVAKVNPALVLSDKEGNPYTVRYDQVNAMLLNEFLKEHHVVQELKKEVAALTAELQKVSVQIELSKAVPQTVLNSR